MIDFNQWGSSDEKKEIDFAAVKALCSSNIMTILEHYQPGGKLINGEYVCATKYGGAGSSCSTNARTGVGADFGSDDKWGDAIDLVAQIEDVSMSEAARRLQDLLTGGSIDCRPTPTIPQQSPEERYAAGQKIALGLWVESEPCPNQHPYLVKKGVNADNGIRLHQQTGNILVPLYDEQGVLWSVQRISPEGEKKINNCGRLSGNFYIIGGERDTVYICEGYATAQTVAMATGKTAVMAVSAGNLATVGEKISKMFPSSHLVFAADNDQKPDSDENPGIKSANNAVKQIGRGTVIAPPFPAGQKGDWNDYAVLHGGKAARELLLNKTRNKLPLLCDLMDFAPTAPKYLIDKLIETPATGVLLGASKSGKTFIALDWALSVATGHKWYGRAVKQGPVIYICGEGKYGLSRRAAAWFQTHGVEQKRGQFYLTTQRVEINTESSMQLTSLIDNISSEHGIPSMIVVDTMARSIPSGCDENSAKDMQAWMNHIDSIRDHYDCMVLIVHHTGHAKDAALRSRGSSAIFGALDFEAAVDRTKGLLINTKMKDGEEWAPIKYALESVKVSDWSSAVVTFDFEYDPKKENKYSANRKTAVKSLYEAVKADCLNGGSCLEDTWRQLYYSCFTDVKPRALQKSFKAEFMRLDEDGSIEINGNIITPAVKLFEDKIASEMFPKC
jgi:phage/plasmid primase-like uncharacterized protein